MPASGGSTQIRPEKHPGQAGEALRSGRRSTQIRPEKHSNQVAMPAGGLAVHEGGGTSSA